MKFNVPDLISSMWIALGLFWLLAPRTRSASAVSKPGGRASSRLSCCRWRFAAHYAGLAITAAGLLLTLFARVCLGSNWSGVVAIKEHHELIRHGPYAWVRHPIYSGLLLAILGAAIAFGEIRCLAAVALAIYGFWRKSRLEERFLVDQFGSAYLEYSLAVKALIPFIL